MGENARAKEKRRRRNATVRCPRCTQPSMVANVLAIVPTDARFKGRRHQTIFTQPVLPAKAVRRSRLERLFPLPTQHVSARLGRWQTPCRSMAGLQSAMQLKGWSQTLIKGGCFSTWGIPPGEFRPFPGEFRPFPGEFRPFPGEFRPRSGPESAEHWTRTRCQECPACCEGLKHHQAFPEITKECSPVNILSHLHFPGSPNFPHPCGHQSKPWVGKSNKPSTAGNTIELQFKAKAVLRSPSE